MTGVADANGSAFTNDVLPNAVDPITALIGLTQAIAEGLGWDDTGNPIDA